MSNQDQSESSTCSAESGGSLLPQRSPTLWPTPKAANPGSRPNGKGGKILEEEVAIAEGLRVRGEKMWPTPCQRDHHPNGEAEGSKNDLGNIVLHHSPTPRSSHSPAPSITATFPIVSALEESKTLLVIRSLSEQVLCRMLSAGASPASRTHAPVNDSPAQTTATSGESVGVFLGTFDPASRCSRTSAACLQASQDFFSTAYCQTWPRFGTLVNGRLYQQVPLALRTGATESGCSAGTSWLTPSANEDAAGTVNGKMQTMLSHQVQGRIHYPTPRASDYKGSGPVGSKSHAHMSEKNYLCAVITELECSGPPSTANGPADRESRSTGGSRAGSQATGKLNPHWVFTLMGYPPLWAEIGRKFTTASRNSKPQATPSSQK